VPKQKASAKQPQPKTASRPPPLERPGDARPATAAKPTPPATQQGTGAGKAHQQKKVDRNALSACGDSAKAAFVAAHGARERKLEPSEAQAMVAATKSIASEIAGEALPGSRARPRALVVEGREVCALQVIDGSRAAEVLDKDPHEFGAMVRRLYLSGPAGGGRSCARFLLLDRVGL